MTSAARIPNKLLRQCREEMGWSQERTAAELRRLSESDEGRPAGVTGNMVCKWEKGEKKPSLRYQRLLRVLFGRTAAELGLVVDDDHLPVSRARPGNDSAGSLEPWGTDVERRAFLRLMAAAGGAAVLPTLAGQPWERLSAALARSADLDAGTVDGLASRTAGFYGLEERVPARTLLASVVRHVDTLTQLLEGSPPSAFRRRLTSAAGEAAALAGWLAFDTNDHASARSYYKVATEAARQADDHALWACVLGYVSYLPSRGDDPREPCVALEEAQRHAAQGATVLTRAWLAARSAEERARVGDRTGALRALERARTAFEHAEGDDDRVWTGFFDRGRLDGLTVATHVRLGQPRAAQAAAESALRSLGPSATKKRALVLADIASAAIGQRDIDEACRFASDALAIVVNTEFAMGLGHLRRVREQLAPWGTTPVVRDFDEQLRAVA